MTWRRWRTSRGPPDRIRQDVSRSPGGDSRMFLNSCIGCHSGMDPMAQAFAYYNFDAPRRRRHQYRLLYTPGTVQAEVPHQHRQLPAGFRDPRRQLGQPLARRARTQVLGWDPTLPGSGNGAKSLGQELARSDAFAQCQVQKVFQAVCYRAPASQLTWTRFQHDQVHSRPAATSTSRCSPSAAVYCMGS